MASRSRWLAWVALVLMGWLALSIVGMADDDDAKVYGTISRLPATQGWVGDWVVSGKTIRVTSSTRIEQKSGAPAVGVYVEVEGARQNDGTIVATKIETKLGSSGGSETEFEGNIEALPNSAGMIGNWTVGGRTVRVTTTTHIKQENAPVTVGVRVQVKGRLQSDGSIAAIEIETKGRSSSSELKGRIESLPSATNRVGDWKVSGRTVRVTPTTKIDQDDGPVAIGAFVEVKGVSQADGSLLATEIEVEDDDENEGGRASYVKFYGTIEALPAGGAITGQWTVSGRKVNVTATTKIEPRSVAPAPGRIVEVAGTLDANGIVTAIKIELKDALGAGQVEFLGRIEALPNATGQTPGAWIGDWRVSGRTVRVTATTRIKREYARVAIGAFVEVKGLLQNDGSINASRIEVKQGTGTGGYLGLASPPASVSAASYGSENASNSIIASFGSNLATGVAAATVQPLPTTLGGASVLVDGVPAGLFFVSPAQINYALPAGIAPGTATVTVMRNAQAVSQGLVDVADVAPSLFTADASGTGAPAGVLLRVKANGQQSYESLVRFDAAMNKLVPATIRRSGNDRLFLILYGTGFRNAPNADGNAGNGVAESTEVMIGTAAAPVLYAAPAPGFSGLDQINVEIPSFAPAGQAIRVVLKVRDGLGTLIQANPVVIAIE
ncbi:MAG: DUF5666 domain-containing protein [Blastocatellia bacterium]|nr:DUF5666 domain-containing protein [Blastocatellia bacterium]